MRAQLDSCNEGDSLDVKLVQLIYSFSIYSFPIDSQTKPTSPSSL